MAAAATAMATWAQQANLWVLCWRAGILNHTIAPILRPAAAAPLPAPYLYWPETVGEENYYVRMVL